MKEFVSCVILTFAVHLSDVQLDREIICKNVRDPTFNIRYQIRSVDHSIQFSSEGSGQRRFDC